MKKLSLLLALCFWGASIAPHTMAQGGATPVAAVLDANAAFDPPALYLTWQRDPTTTMTVCWQTIADAAPRPDATRLEYRKAEAWLVKDAVARPMPHSNRITHQAELTDLQPGTVYQFRFGPNSKVYVFRTMPAQPERPVRFATGGDTMHQKKWWEKTNREVLKYDPDFILLGGDLCYENGAPDQVKRVYDWLDGAKNSLITADNRVVPILAAIGNHEVAGAYGKTAEHAPYYHNLFPFPGPQGYGVLDFGDYMSLILLNTAHTSPIEGAQSEWLAATLEKRREVPHVFPIYHVPAYPSVRKFEDKYNQLVRQHWTPLFDRFGVRVVFENHDHSYKRTHPIFGNKVDYTRGVTYIGDGAWGVEVRKVHPESWYLASAISARHFIVVNLQGRSQQFQAIDEDGKLIDQFPEASTLPLTPPSASPPPAPATPN